MDVIIASVIGIVLSVLIVTVSSIAINCHRSNDQYGKTHTGSNVFVILILVTAIVGIIISVGLIIYQVYLRYSPQGKPLRGANIAQGVLEGLVSAQK